MDPGLLPPVQEWTGSCRTFVGTQNLKRKNDNDEDEMLVFCWMRCGEW